MTNTEENLKAAFAGESQANRKYLAFAKKAEEEGLKQIAKLFRAAADAETVHAHNHLRVMGGIKSTVENLKGAISGETYEFTDMYPKMIEDAEKDNNKEVKATFNKANPVEKIHAGLYTNALELAESGKDLEEKQILVCQICGNTVENKAPDTCQICGANKDQFKLIE
ncbi:MAG: rubrerythrin family protein [Candidatus Aenigmarchaeota archaeon]|nr:rubrerythrin family protein [Candidatus Aenigmarchaeota archaeon]